MRKAANSSVAHLRPLGRKNEKCIVDISCHQAELLKEALHVQAQGSVALVNGRWVLNLGLDRGLRSRREQGFDHLVVKDPPRRQGSKPLGGGLITTGGLDPASQLFGAKFLQVVGGTPRAIFRFRLAALGTNLPRQLGSREPS